MLLSWGSKERLHGFIAVLSVHASKFSTCIKPFTSVNRIMPRDVILCTCSFPLPWKPHCCVVFGSYSTGRLCTCTRYFYRVTACNATHGIAKAFLSVCLSNAWIVTKRKKNWPTFLYHMEGHSSYFLARRMVSGGDRFIAEILNQTHHVGAKTPISIDIRS